MMKRLAKVRNLTLSLMMLVSTACRSPASLPLNEPEAIARKQSADGWIDLLPGKDLKGFRRVPIDPLAQKPVWSVSEDGKLLLIDGVSAKEMLLCVEDLGDGLLHVEWRFRKQEGENPVYNGGVYVRTAIDGSIWVQAQVAHADKPPVAGDLFAMVPVDGGDPRRVEILQSSPSPVNPPGEWNVYDLACEGKTVTLSVNGKKTAEWTGCPVTKGHVGLQAEFAFIEVRSFKFKPKT